MQSCTGRVHFLSLQCCDQLQKAVDNGLVEQVDEQGLAAAPAEEFRNGAFPERAGQARFFVRVDRPAEDSAEHIPAEMRQEGKVIAGRKALADEAEREKEFCLYDRAGDEIAGHDEHKTHGGERLRGQFFVDRIEHHADAEQMQNAEPDDHIARGHAEAVHAEGHKRDEHAAGKDDAAAAEAARAERGAAAGQDDENHASVLLDEHIPRGQMQVEADKVDQIKDQMDEDHAEDAKAAQRVQLPDAVGFLHGNHLKSVQPAAKRGRLPK